MQKLFSGYALGRLGPKLMNRCTAERLHTKEHGKLLRNINLEEGEVPDSKAKVWEVGRGGKTEECKRLRE